MRTIKFRAKDFHNNKFVFGNLIKMDETGSQNFIFPFFERASTMSCGEIIKFGLIAIDENTIGQYIGLKDKNNVEIYEGDIVKDGNGELFEVEWQPFSGAWNLSGTEHHFLVAMRYMNTFEVIGNIYENPELLESEAKE